MEYEIAQLWHDIVIPVVRMQNMLGRWMSMVQNYSRPIWDTDTNKRRYELSMMKNVHICGTILSGQSEIGAEMD
jgi:hypothetical protein